MTVATTCGSQKVEVVGNHQLQAVGVRTKGKGDMKWVVLLYEKYPSRIVSRGLSAAAYCTLLLPLLTILSFLVSQRSTITSGNLSKIKYFEKPHIPDRSEAHRR